MKAMRAWLAGRTARERWLATLTIVVALATLAEAKLLAPQRAERARIARELATARDQFARLQSALPAAAAQDGLRNAALSARRAAAQAAIHRAQLDLITPLEMPEQLAAIVARHPRLRVIGIQSQPPVSLLGQPGDRPGGAHALYRHGLQVQVEGRYPELMSYVAALEATPRRLYWRALDLKVPASGVPITTIELFTLSTDSAWLRL